MNFLDLKKSASTFKPIMYLESSLPHRSRRVAKQALLILALLSLLALMVLNVLAVTTYVPQILGAIFMLFSLWLIFFALDTYYYAYSFRSLEMTQYRRKVREEKIHIDFETSTVIEETNKKDVVKGFLNSTFGRQIMRRTGITQTQVKDFLAMRHNSLPAEQFEVEGDNIITLAEYVGALVNHDIDFRDFLMGHSIQEVDIVGTAAWVSRQEQHRKTREGWWRKNNLRQIPGIGKSWSYGRAFKLEKFSRDVDSLYSGLSLADLSYHNEEVDKVETILSRAKEANVLLVGEAGIGKMNIIGALSKKIAEGHVHPSLEHKKIMALDHNSLMASLTEGGIEAALISIFNDVVKAGNIILVIPEFPNFINQAKGEGVDLVSVLDPYISGNALQLIALADNVQYHQTLESNSTVAQRFETVLVEEGDNESVITLIEDKVLMAESRHGIYFTYPAVKSLVTGADRYITEGVMPDKAYDVLIEIVPYIKKQGRKVVKKNDIQEFIEDKTGIPLGTVSADERDKLINLESILHKRVVGQNMAIEGISNALRRARAGVTNPNRPIGSFLFLGPTGVGKTETTKALAEVFFGTREINRLDMSEFHGTDALNKLIGSFENNQPGMLSSMVREHPYGVLLLDEFEKTHPQALDLFLQVLDEGVFSDMTGRKVNARNMIIIATSNAGSDLIFDWVSRGEDLKSHRDEIINTIIAKKIFKPELINRFDGTILFHPLDESHLRQIAGLMLAKLQGRLRKQGINLIVNEALIHFLVKQGNDPKFGARPLNRAIQDTIEGVIAKKLLSGDIKPGAYVELSEEELVS